MAASGVPTDGWLLFGLVVALMAGAAALGGWLRRRDASRAGGEEAPSQEGDRHLLR
jgi:hypothetical protein